MTPERFEKVRALFAEVLGLAPAERDAFLKRRCGSDLDLLAEVQLLLSQSEGDASSLASFRIKHSQTTSTITTASDAAADSNLLATRLKERYVLQRELGRGGFGIVYLATDEQLVSKPVVVKILRNSAPDAWERKKFRTEIEALARLNHPGIVSILDSGQTPDARPFLVMEYVEGVSLRSLLRPEGMDLDRVGNIVRQIGSALEAAHQVGIWHRDLKPENVLIQTPAEGDERTKLIDFGIATVQGLDASSDSTTHVAGTFRYMAPEQLRGKPTAATDIFSLGVIAYEMVTGRVPFPAETATELYLLQKAGVEIMPSTLRRALPDQADRCILKALQFDERDRHPSVASFAKELANALRALPPEKFPAREGEPHLGRLVSKMCDRRAQEDEFKSFLQRNAKRRGVAAFCLIHGDEGECHESLVERLAYHAEAFARGAGGEARPPVKLVKIPWQHEGPRDARLRRMVAWLFERLEIGYEPQDSDGSPAALGSLLASSPATFILLQHDIRGSRWDDLTKGLIESYIQYWSRVPFSPSVAQVIIFLNVIYPETPKGSWPQLLLSPKALAKKLTKSRIQRDLTELACKRGSDSGHSACPCLLLEELKPITRDDVLEWFSLHNILETEDQRLKAASKIFGATAPIALGKRMAEIETHLREVQRTFLFERGFI